MKILNIILVMLVLGSTSHAQSKNEGVITYNMEINLHKQLSPEQEAFKAMVPEFMSQIVEVSYDPNGYIINTKPSSNDDNIQFQMGTGEHHTIVIDNQRQVYYNFISIDDNAYYTESTIEYPALSFDKANTETILGYTCYKATYNMGGKLTTLWYTKDLGLSISPELPQLKGGTVLKLITEEASYLATNIEFKDQPNNLIEQHISGKKITQDQFDDLQDELMESYK